MANNFWNYARESSNAIDATPYIPVVPIPGTPTVREGDIVLYSTADSTPTNPVWQHAMIVTVVGKDEIYLTYHSNDTLNRPLSSVITRIGHSVQLTGLDVTPTT